MTQKRNDSINSTASRAGNKIQKQQQKEAFDAKVEESFRRYSVNPDDFFSEASTPFINVQRATKHGSQASLANLQKASKLRGKNSKMSLRNASPTNMATTAGGSKSGSVLEDGHEAESNEFCEMAENEFNNNDSEGMSDEENLQNLLDMIQPVEKKKKKRKSRWDKRKKSMMGGYDIDDSKSFGPYGAGFESSMAIAVGAESEQAMGYADNASFKDQVRNSLGELRESLSQPAESSSQTKTLLHKMDKDSEKYILNPKGIFRGSWDRFTVR